MSYYFSARKTFSLLFSIVSIPVLLVAGACGGVSEKSDEQSSPLRVDWKRQFEATDGIRTPP
jgi:hypothetical protein